MAISRFLPVSRLKTGFLFLTGRQSIEMLLNKFASLPLNSSLTAKMRVYYF